MSTENNQAKNNRYLIIGVAALVLLVLIILPKLRNNAIDETLTPQFTQVNGNVVLTENSPIKERIEIEAVVSKELSRTISSPATVEANPSKRANIFPPFEGRITQLNVNMGDQVRANQPLFQFYAPDAAEIQAAFISAQSEVAQAESNLRRTQALNERGIASQRELEEATNELQIARAEKNAASQIMQITGIGSGASITVRSPINGRVVALEAAAGAFISEAEEPVMIIADLSSVWVTANIQEKNLRFISRNMKVSISLTAFPGETYEGEVLFINDILDEETRTTRVRVAIDNPEFKLKPGMFANVNFHTTPQNHIVVPPTAILQRRDYNYVYVEVAPHTFEKRIVETSDTIDGNVIILSGLEEGERVIARNAVLLP